MKEEEIRPQELFDELLRLNRLDIEKYFSKSQKHSIACPACQNKGVIAFDKDGFVFDECLTCKTLYVSPRPEKKYFDAYYTDSDSTKFWATTFYKATEKNRREMLWKPKAKLIVNKIQSFSPDTSMIVDIGGGYGTFMEEFLKLLALEHLVVEPSAYLSKVCRDKNLNVLSKFLEDMVPDELPSLRKTFVSFELFEHLHEPRKFLQTLHGLMSSGDMFIFTTLSGMGVDIRTLWQHSKAVSPPMHLNFFNPKSISHLLNALGFQVVEVSTPGKLDIDIMNNNKANLKKERFWSDFLEYASDEEKQHMQNFISDNLLSSHMMIVCLKP
ncbi:MAG: class I SAM-dependent methyltransferase [Campylobacterales bacterium]|nr:class I SAM-dependent methyltransferase [Campylobacterales bacterium]